MEHTTKGSKRPSETLLEADDEKVHYSPDSKLSELSLSVKETPKSPIWAANQVLFKTEPPKPPESVAAYYVLTHHSGASNLSQAEIDLVWENLSKKQKIKCIEEHNTIEEDYFEKFEHFVRSLAKDDLKAFRVIMNNRLQGVKAKGSKKPETSPAHDENLDSSVSKLSKLSLSAVKSSEIPESPIWAANQVLFKTEPPKPPESVAAYYVLTHHSGASNLSQAEIDLVWENLSKKQKIKCIEEHDTIEEDYFEKFEHFVRSLAKDDLKAFRVIMNNRLQGVKAKGSKKPETSTSHDEHLDSPVSKLSELSLSAVYDEGNCAICLSGHINKSILDCGHVYCFQCLVDWCKIKLECPTCKQPFQTFRHSIQIQPPLEQIYTPDPPTTAPINQQRH